jgi:hypothetical protein
VISILDLELSSFETKALLLQRVRDLFGKQSLSEADRRFVARAAELDLQKMPLLLHHVLQDNKSVCAQLLLNTTAIDQRNRDYQLVCMAGGYAWSATGATAFVETSRPPLNISGLFACRPNSSRDTASFDLTNLESTEIIGSATLRELARLASRSSIRIDFDGPIFSLLVQDKPTFIRLNNSYQEVAIQRLSHELDRIEVIWPEMHASIEKTVSCIAMSMSDTEKVSRVVRHGASYPTVPGVIFMNDYHRREVLNGEVAENLIHEATHNMLFFLELGSPWFASLDEAVHGKTLQSVWSERQLSPYSFFHSLIVFATIINWLTRVQRSTANDDEHGIWAKTRILEINAGFNRLKSIYEEDILSGELLPTNSFGLSLYRDIICPWTSRH